MLGSFRLLEEIGAGGMGHVYRAHDTVLDRDVAIKLVAREFLSSNAQAVERFLSEARLTARIRHRNIVQVYGFGTDPAGSPYFVMELLHGRNLLDALKANEPFPLARIINIGSQILSALTAAHEHVVHRDLKPGNVFLTSDADGNDCVTVLDFGVAKAVNDATADLTGQKKLVLGTRRYSAPEMLLGTGMRDDPRQDLYSLGVILFQMAARKSPWTPAELDVVEKLLRIGRKPQPLLAAAPEVDPFFAEIVDRALAVDPAERWQSAGAFRAALRSFGDFAPGAIINETYRIERKLGGGEASVVFLADDIRMERACALKALLVAEKDDPNGKIRERFRRDGALAKEVRHPNVVAVYAQGVWRERPYIVAEYIDGKTLREFAGTADWVSFVAVIRQIAAALDAVHQAGIVHRDVTPENILVACNGTAKLVDFGIARRASSDLTGTSVGFLFGRYGYTAPEQAANPTDVSAVSDEWSLAAIVYEALTGLAPFRDTWSEEQPHAIEDYIARLLNVPTPEDPEKLNSTVSPELARVILRALSNDVTLRFPTALAFAESLAAAPSTGVRLKASIGTRKAPGCSLNKHPISSTATPFRSEPRDTKGRWPPRWRAAVLSLLLVGVGGVTATFLLGISHPAGDGAIQTVGTRRGDISDSLRAAAPPQHSVGLDVRAQPLLPDAGTGVIEITVSPDAPSSPSIAPRPSVPSTPIRKAHHSSDAVPRSPKKLPVPMLPEPNDKEGILKI